MYRQSLLIALVSLSILPATAAETQPASAPERTQCKLPDHADVTIEYETMRMEGRKIFGGLVPYGKLWETGEKRPPMFVTSANVVLGGKDIPAGSYTVATIPEAEKWTMILKKTFGNKRKGPADEVARVDLLVRHLPSPRESFGITFDQYKSGCLLNLRWEQIEASVLLVQKR